MANSKMFIQSQRKETNSTISLLNREYDSSNPIRSNNQLIRDRYHFANNLYRKDLHAHYGCVNAIEFSDNGTMMVTGGDDRRVLLWNVERAISGSGQAQIMKGEHNSNIFCLGFDSHCERIFSAGNDEIIMIHDAHTAESVDVILNNDAIYGISVDPINDNVFATASDDGRICLWDVRGPRDPFILASYSSAFHAVMHNPFESRVIATANTKEGVALWDVRKPRNVLRQFNSSLLSSQSAMSVRFNKQGTFLLALRRRLPPVLYNLTSPYPIVEFDNNGYYNSCTMKSCSFGGDSDQYVLSGSDDFKLYMWQIPDQVFLNQLTTPESTVWVDQAELVLSGHRSIVNQVRYNYANSIIASSGVEKVIKFWGTFPLPFGTGGLDPNGSSATSRDNRKIFSHEDYINLVLESGQFVTHDYSHQSVQEDPRMMAFFDSLVQRDIEGWTSSDDSSDDSIGCNTSFYELCWNSTILTDDSNSDSNSPNSSANNSDNEDASLPNWNSHIMSYLDILAKRIEANKQSQAETRKSHKDKREEASTSSCCVQTDSAVAIKEESLDGEKQSKGASSATLNTTYSTRSSGSLNQHSADLDIEYNDSDRISKLITEKKRDQLRKMAKLTVRTAKKRLKRIKKTNGSNIAGNGESSHGEDKMEKLQNKLDLLAQQVESDSKDSEGKNERDSSRKMHRRLRFLTNQSDLVFNEVLPVASDSSDSSDSNFVSGDELYDVLTNEVDQMRHLLPNDSDLENNVNSDSSDDSFEALIALNAANIEGINDATSSSEEEKEGTGETSGTSKPSKPENEMNKVASNLQKLNRIHLALTYDESTESSDDEEIGKLEKVIHCPYNHNLCQASTSSASDPHTQAKIKKSLFKPIDTRRRTYRKRKRSGGSGNASTSDNKVSNNNDQNCTSDKKKKEEKEERKESN